MFIWTKSFNAFFCREIDGKAYEAYVKEKEEAKKDYIQAQSQGQSAGLVEKRWVLTFLLLRILFHYILF